MPSEDGGQSAPAPPNPSGGSGGTSQRYLTTLHSRFVSQSIITDGFLLHSGTNGSGGDIAFQYMGAWVGDSQAFFLIVLANQRYARGKTGK
jgi:hypothetical protein